MDEDSKFLIKFSCLSCAAILAVCITLWIVLIWGTVEIIQAIF